MKILFPSIWMSFWYVASSAPTALALFLNPKLLPLASLFGWAIWFGALAIIKKVSEYGRNASGPSEGLKTQRK